MPSEREPPAPFNVRCSMFIFFSVLPEQKQLSAYEVCPLSSRGLRNEGQSNPVFSGNRGGSYTFLKILVPEARIELARAQGPRDFESSASTSSTTPARPFPDTKTKL